MGQKHKKHKSKIADKVKHGAKKQSENQEPAKGNNGLLNNKPLVWNILYLLILSVGFIITYNYIFDEKIDIGGDNALYYSLSKALAAGEGFVKLSSRDPIPHNHFPPGYPSILAVFQVLGVKSIVGLKMVNGLFYLGCIFIWYKLISKITGDKRLAFATGALIIVNTALLKYSTIIMSEITFLFFLSLAFLFMSYLKPKETPPWKSWAFLGLILSLLMNFYIRSLGLGLVAGVILFFLYYKYWKYAVGTAGLFFLGILPWQIRSRDLGGGNYVDQLLRINPYRPEKGYVTVGDMITRVWDNFSRYVTSEIPSGLFSFIQPDYRNIQASDWFIGLVIVALIIMGILKCRRPYKHIFLGYLFCTFGILLLWPDVWFGTRFLAPSIPLLLFLALLGAVLLFEKGAQRMNANVNLNPIWLVILVPFTFPALEKSHQSAEAGYPPRWDNYFKIAKWCKNNTDKNALISCRKPNLFYLYADRPTCRYRYTKDSKKIIETYEERNVNYVVLDRLGFSSTPRYLLPAIRNHKTYFRRIMNTRRPKTFLFEFISQQQGK